MPGSGGLEYATEGGSRERFDPIWTAGTSPEVDGPGDEYEDKQEAQFQADPDNVANILGISVKEAMELLKQDEAAEQFTGIAV
jgi:hypothetical protein